MKKRILNWGLLIAVLVLSSIIAYSSCEKGICLVVAPKKEAIGTPARITVSNTRKDPIQVTITVQRPSGGSDTVIQDGRIEAGSSRDYKYENTSEAGKYTVKLVSGTTTLTEAFEREKKPLPDLIVTALWAEQRARCSWDATVWALVKNVGDAVARGVVVAFYIDGTRLSTPSSFDLEPGKERTISTAWNIPPRSSPWSGSYTLYAKVDPDNTIPESNEANNDLRKDVGVEVQRECARWDQRCVQWERRCVQTECARWERRCVRYGQRGECLQWQDVCVEWRCVRWEDVCVKWENVCVEWRDCPYLRSSRLLTGQAARQPWSGWWWPLKDSLNPNMYDKGGPLDKYDQYVLATRGYNPGARAWEEKAQGSTLLSFILVVEDPDGHRGIVKLGKHGRPIDAETKEALTFLKALLTKSVPLEKVEEEIRILEEKLYLGGLWWDGFQGDIPSLRDLIAHSWKIQKEAQEELGEAPAWMGLCDGWAAAAMMEEEPTQPRTLYGIDFSVADLKGLLTKVWQQAYFEAWEPTPKNLHEKLQEVITERGLPLLMDLAPGREVSTYPAYHYEIRKLKEEGPTATFEAEVWFAGFASPDFIGTTYFTRTFRYRLTFDDHWNVIEGSWVDSAAAPDGLIWVPVAARPGNPRVDPAIVREINAKLVVTLYWDKKVDLDLRVIGPQGEISRLRPKVGTGRLDRNVTTGGPRSSESIFWPQGEPLGKTYTVQVEYTGSGEESGPVNFTVRVVIGQQACERQGTLKAVGESYSFTFSPALPTSQCHLEEAVQIEESSNK
jgi:hypothetical protein